MSETVEINNRLIRLEKADVTDFSIEAFVFYANSNLELGAGYGNAISMRGGPAIKKELSELDAIEVGQAVVSSAGEMKADYIIHAVGPKFQEADTEKKLKTTISNALKAAESKGIKRIAFPPMGAGFYGIPLQVCARIMLETFKDYLGKDSLLEEIVICAIDAREYKPFESAMKSFI